MIGSARAGTIAERHSCGPNFKALKCAHSRARPESCFFLDSGLTWMIGRHSTISMYSGDAFPLGVVS